MGAKRPGAVIDDDVHALLELSPAQLLKIARAAGNR
jgi:hypothetical protein